MRAAVLKHKHLKLDQREDRLREALLWRGVGARSHR